MKKSIVILTAFMAAAAALTACQGKASEATTAAPAATTAATDETSAEAETTAEAETEAAPADLEKIIVGASPAPHAEILRAAQDVLAQKGYELEVLEYVDYIQPNLALESGDLDANYFQHLPYLESFNEENKTKLVSAGAIHYEPFGIYAGKTASLEELADLLEVMRAVVQARGWTWEQLEQVRQEKPAQRGGFEKKILLKEVIEK